MKQKLRLMAMLWPILTIMCFGARAQEAGNPAPVADGQLHASENATIHVGTRVPAEFWTRKRLVYHNSDTSSVSLEQFKGKFLLLDFWATWCGYCRANLPKLEKLQQQYPEELAVMLVNVKRRKDTYDKIDRVYQEQFTQTGGASLPSVIYDEYIIKLFPHTAIPHYVWISPSGRVLAITISEFVDSHQLETLLNTKIINL